MELKPFIKKTVKPGEPLTAQAWNELSDAIDAMRQFLAATLHTVRVTITNTGLDLEHVRVTASRESGPPVEAVRPIPPGKDHIISELDAGAWTITAETAGYETATQVVNIVDAGETSIQMGLQLAGKFMPDLFGATLATARTVLGAQTITIARVIDFNGRDLPPTQSDPEIDNAPVLVQWPPPNSAMPPDGAARLVIATPVKIEASIAVPALTSMTQQEARKALESIGLVLGKVTFAQR